MALKLTTGWLWQLTIKIIIVLADQVLWPAQIRGKPIDEVHASIISLTLSSQYSHFWATVCKTVRPMLSDSCLSCLSVLSVMLVYCGQTVGRIKMKLAALQVGLGPDHNCVRWGPSSPSPNGVEPPNFRPISVVAKWLDGSRCHLVWRKDSAQATLC